MYPCDDIILLVLQISHFLRNHYDPAKQLPSQFNFSCIPSLLYLDKQFFLLIVCPEMYFQLEPTHHRRMLLPRCISLLYRQVEAAGKILLPVACLCSWYDTGVEITRPEKPLTYIQCSRGSPQ